MPFIHRGQKNCVIIGYWTLVMHLDTLPALCSSLWRITEFQPSLNHHVLQIM